MKYPVDTSNRPRLQIVGIHKLGMVFEEVPEPPNYYCWLYKQFLKYKKLVFLGYM